MATTEAPVKVFDWEEYDFIDEVVRMDGLSLPQSKQVPLLDSHNRYSVEDVLGSAKDFKVVDDVSGYRGLECTVFYSSDEKARAAAEKTFEGHLTDYSIGYRANEVFRIPRGEKQVINGETYEGPMRVVTQWELKELSATPIGADEFAKARSARDAITTRGKQMPDKVKDNEKKVTNEGGQSGEVRSGAAEDQKDTVSRADAEQMAAEAADKARREEIDRQAEARRREAAISEMGTKARLDKDFIKNLVDGDLSVDQARAVIFEEMTKDKPGAIGARQFQMGADEVDKFRTAAAHGLALRAGVAVENPAPGANTFRGMSLLRIAEQCLRMAGQNPESMTNQEMARRALQLRDIPGTSTGTLPNLLQSTADRVLREAYVNYPSTWQRWARATDASDFREINRVALTGAPEMQFIPEGGEYKDFQPGEEAQSYAVKKYGRKFSVTWEAIVNDDLGALTRIPRLFGGAASRLINSTVYAVLTANGAMWDGTALFHADHGNLEATNVGAPNDTTLKYARAAMRTQADPDGNYMNIIPMFGLFPAALEHEAYVILNSATLLTTASDADNANANIPNPYRNMVDPVIDPVLDGSSETAWYLMASYNQIDTVEVSFLDGRQEPEVMEIENPNIDGVSWKARIVFGAAAIDWRGMFKNPGA